jgi:hypothetical protein
MLSGTMGLAFTAVKIASGPQVRNLGPIHATMFFHSNTVSVILDRLLPSLAVIVVIKRSVMRALNLSYTEIFQRMKRAVS